MDKDVTPALKSASLTETKKKITGIKVIICLIFK